MAVGRYLSRGVSGRSAAAAAAATAAESLRCVRAGRHRDGFSAPELDAYYRFGDNPFTIDPFCQMRNTNTLIFTMGDQAMEMPLSFPLDKCDAGNVKEYRTHPLLTIPLLNGTLLIYAPLG